MSANLILESHSAAHLKSKNEALAQLNYWKEKGGGGGGGGGER